MKASWVARTTANLSTKSGDVEDELKVEGPEVAATPAAAARQRSRRKQRAERRNRAAVILRQNLGDEGGGAGTAIPDSEAQSEEATGVELAREARQRAQETFISRRIAEA